MTRCFECNLSEPLEVDTLHEDGRILCISCGELCQCNHVSMVDPIELQLPTPWDTIAGMLTAQVKPLGNDRYEVLNFVDVILIPGDIVTASDFQITDLVQQSPKWAWDVTYPLEWKDDPERIYERQRVYAEGAYCEVATLVSLQMASESPELERAIRADPEVTDVEVMRDPTKPVTLEALMREHYPRRES